MFDPTKLPYKKGNDYLQTRVRYPRKVMPNFSLYCDWIIWDEQNIYIDTNAIARTIYVRSEIGALNYFINHVLDRISHDFVLITSSHDTTMPIGFQRNYGLDWRVIVQNEYLKAWFTENMDLRHEKIFPMPLGIPHPDLPSWVVGDQSTPVWTEEYLSKAWLLRSNHRIPKIFCCWYYRDNHPSGTCSDLNNERRGAYENLIGKDDIFDWYPPGMSRVDFVRKMGHYQFVLCPHGGGLDPNPRCWEALIAGSIPIVRRNTMTDSLKHLPIVFVDRWAEITLEKLEEWEREYSPKLKDENLQYLMSNAYFYSKIEEKLAT